MVNDIRVSVDIMSNPKVLAFGEAIRDKHKAVGILIDLWTWVAKHRPDGDTRCTDEKELCRAMGWHLKRSSYLQLLANFTLTLRQVGVHNTQQVTIHIADWKDWQPYVVNHRERSTKARQNARKRWSKTDADGNANGNANGNALRPYHPKDLLASAKRQGLTAKIKDLDPAQIIEQMNSTVLSYEEQATLLVLWVDDEERLKACHALAPDPMKRLIVRKRQERGLEGTQTEKVTRDTTEGDSGQPTPKSVAQNGITGSASRHIDAHSEEKDYEYEY